MNVIDATVIEILGKPELKYNKWFVKAKVSAYGRESETDQMFSSKSEAEAFKVGDTVQV